MGPGATAQILRPGLLRGLDVVLAAAPEEVRDLLTALGADVRILDVNAGDEQAVIDAAQSLELATVVVCDAGPAMRAAADPVEGLRAAVEDTWVAARAVVNAHLVPGGFGKLLLIAPRPADGATAGAAAAALENLARTTSVEWARLGIRVVALRPGDVTTDAALAQLVAYLASPGGDYFSGTLLDLGAAGLSGVS